jgi:hypothetical protein
VQEGFERNKVYADPQAPVWQQVARFQEGSANVSLVAVHRFSYREAQQVDYQPSRQREQLHQAFLIPQRASGWLPLCH